MFRLPKLNNINFVPGISLVTTEIASGGMTIMQIGTTEETPEGIHPLTIIIDGEISNIFYLVVGDFIVAPPTGVPGIMLTMLLMLAFAVGSAILWGFVLRNKRHRR